MTGSQSGVVKDEATFMSLILGVPASTVTHPVSYTVDKAADGINPTGSVDARTSPPVHGVVVDPP